MSEKGLSRDKLKSYEVNGEVYRFPSVGQISPGNEDATGVLEQWPAYSSKRNIPSNQLVVTKDRRLMVVDEKHTKLPNLIPKPKFLQYLEEYLKKELKKHNASKKESSDIQLDIYREVFDYLLEAFKTYRPLLSEIKRAYEECISKLRQEIRNLEPMKEIIWTISEERNKQVLQIKEEEKQDISNLKNDKINLLKRVAEMEADQQTLVIQIEKLKESLSEEHHAFRNEADARKLLILDINEMRQQIDDLSNLAKSEETDSKDDPVVLRMALEEAKKCHTSLLTQLTRMETDYANVVPKRDFEILQKQYLDLQESSQSNAQSLDQLQIDYQALEDKFAALQQQRDFYYVKYMELNKSSTPRPEWKKCGEAVSAGSSWWNDQIKDKSSRVLLDLLIQEMTQTSSVKEKIDAKGDGLNVPKFLRSEGKINLRNMPKRDVKIHIREIWTGRKLMKEEQYEALSKGEEFKLEPITDFVDMFFRKTYGIEQIRLEWAYSFYESLNNEQTDTSIIQFRQIINGEMDEEVYWQEMNLFNMIYEACKSKDPENRNLILKEDLKSIIESIHIKKMDEEESIRLMEIALIDLPSEGEENQFIQYGQLFLTNDEGKYGPFLAEILKSFNNEKKAYVNEITKELKDVGTKINTIQLKECIQIVDPEIPVDALNQYLSWCFNTIDSESAESHESMSVEDLINKLMLGAVKRHSIKI